VASLAPYRQPAHAKKDAYLAAWEEYRRRRVAKWIVFFTTAGAGKLWFRWMGGPDGFALYAFLAAACVVLAWLAWLGVFVCPRCGARMYVSGALRDRDDERCPQCGIAVGEKEED
jgi:hypothetical protein